MRASSPGRLVLFATLSAILCGGTAVYGRDVTLGWNANTQPQLAGYKVYYGTSPRSYDQSVDAGGATSYTFRNVAQETCCFAVTAYDTMGKESGYSNEVCILPNGQLVDGGTSAFDFTTPGSDLHAGMTITNFQSVEALLKLTAYSRNGTVSTDTVINNPAFFVLAPGQQMRASDTQLLNRGGTPEPYAGWIQVDSAPAVTGFSSILDGAGSVLNGMLVSNAAASSFVLPDIEDRWSTQVRVVNPGNAPSNILFTFMDSEGLIRNQTARLIDSHGLMIESLAGLFTGTAPDSSGYLLVASDKALIHVELLGGPAGKARMIDALDPSSGGIALYAPLYGHGDAWKSSISIVNLDSTGGEVTVNLRGNDGAPIGKAVTLSLPARGKIRMDDPDLFANPAGSAVLGSLELTSSGPRIAGTLTFSDPEGVNYAATLPLISTPANTLLFPHVDKKEGFFTGIALFNPNEEPAQVTLEVFAEDGRSLGMAREWIAGRGSTCKLLTEYLTSLAGDYQLSMELTSDKAIAGLAVIGAQDWSSVAALAAHPSGR
jgi:hypothetical protein